MQFNIRSKNLILHSFHRYNQIEEVKHLLAKDTFKLPYSDGPSNYARALFHMPSLRSLELADNYLQDEDFYTTMAAEAKESQVNTVQKNILLSEKCIIF